jgi:phage baseplate assembly protein W
MKVNRTQVKGMDARTGKPLTGVAHLKQSIEMIVTTLIGTRVMRRDFGSTIPALIDAPANKKTVLTVYAAIALALKQFEPRLKLTRVYAEFDDLALAGKTVFSIEGEYLGEKVSTDITL